MYLNDSFGNLGRGDTVPPEITLLGETTVSIAARSVYIDAGVTMTDNIDSGVQITLTTTSTVNTSVVGNYTVTYNATDFAGNAATAVVRNVTVTPASGTGGGGGKLSVILLVALFGFLLYGNFGTRREAV